MAQPVPVQWHALQAPPVEAGDWAPVWIAVIMTYALVALRTPTWAGATNDCEL